MDEDEKIRKEEIQWELKVRKTLEDMAINDPFKLADLNEDDIQTITTLGLWKNVFINLTAWIGDESDIFEQCLISFGSYVKKENWIDILVSCYDHDPSDNYGYIRSILKALKYPNKWNFEMIKD